METCDHSIVQHQNGSDVCLVCGVEVRGYGPYYEKRQDKHEQEVRDERVAACS